MLNRTIAFMQPLVASVLQISDPIYQPLMIAPKEPQVRHASAKERGLL